MYILQLLRFSNADSDECRDQHHPAQICAWKVVAMMAGPDSYTKTEYVLIPLMGNHENNFVQSELL